MKAMYACLIATTLMLSCGKKNKSDDKPEQPAPEQQKPQPPQEQPQQPQSQQNSLELYVFGDSLAAGSLAGTNAGDALSADNFGVLMKAIEQSKEQPENFDLITQNTNEALSSPDETAFEGNKEYSFGPRLEKLAQKKVEVRRYAVPGARTNTLQTQIDNMKKDQSEGRPKADFVVLHIGGNDWCDVKPDADFKNDFSAALKNIMSENPEAKILVLPVPNISKVMSIADTDAFKGTFQDFEKKIACSEVRQYINVCRKRDIGFGATPEALAPFESSLQSYNQIVSDVAKNAPNESPNFKGKIVVAESYGKGEGFDSTWLGSDCFHPGSHGQNKIADAVWPYMEDLLK